MLTKYGKHIKVWKKHYGNIPKDINGKSYEIHHIDGNPDNNNIENLKCVTIEEHYEIHRIQGDYSAAFLIAKRMNLSKEELSEIVRKSNIDKLEKGIHNFQNPNFPRSLYHNKGYVVAIDIRTNDIVRIRKEDFDTNDFYVGVNQGRKQKTIHKNRGKSKGKRWTLKNKRRNIVICPHCNKSGDASGLKRWHFDNCKEKI